MLRRRPRHRHHHRAAVAAPAPGAPPGFEYVPGFVDAGEERDLVALLAALTYEPVVMRGQVARRSVRQYGYRYGFESFALEPAEPLPGSLAWVRDRAANLADLEPDDLAEVLVIRYPVGAGIGWHRDAPSFGPTVIGVSLGASCRMRFQRGAGDERLVHAVELEPSSAYVLGGAARSTWQHQIPPTRAERFSITFRTVRDPARWASPA